MNDRVTKSDITVSLCEKLGISKKIAIAATNQIFEEITSQLRNGNSVVVSGFGTFSTKERNERKFINPRTNVSQILPKQKSTIFKPSKRMLEAINYDV